MDAQSRIPKVYEPLEFEDGLAYLMKTDILSETMYFSYDQSSMANLYPVYAEDVLRGRAEITKLVKRNARNGLVEVTIEAYNQNGEHVLSDVTEVIVKCIDL